MTFGFALITVAIILIDSGWKKKSIAEVLRSEGGKTTTNEATGESTEAEGTNMKGKGVPKGLVMFDGKHVAAWIVPSLKYARQHGWKGVVTSGYRSDAEQTKIGTEYAKRIGKTVAEVYPHGLLASNHTKTNWPGGAVDVTDAPGLARALKGWRHEPKLIWGNAVIDDGVHFSATGH